MKRIGLTGGVASGKTSVSNQLKKNGFAIIDTDEIVHRLLESDKAVLGKIEKEFGTTNRRDLRKIVFADNERRAILERIIHPRVGDEVQDQIAELERRKHKPKAAVVVVPLLFEVGWEKGFDCVAAVVSSEKDQINRLIKRDGISKELAKQMVRSQLSSAEKAKRAKFVIKNVGTLKALEKSVDQLLPKILKN